MKKYLIALSLVGLATTSCYEKLNIAPPNRITNDQIQELLKSGEVDFTIGQDLAYQPYQALSVLFEALMGQRPDRDTYVTACPILNSESI